jgi:hypothetical protein
MNRRDFLKASAERAVEAAGRDLFPSERTSVGRPTSWAEQRGVRGLLLTLR